MSNWFFGGYSAEEMSLLQTTFGKLRNHLEDIGVEAFTKLYDENHDAYAVFASNKLLPDERQAIAESAAARQHCLRVMNAVELCANKLNNEQAIVDYVGALAVRHCGFGIKADHFLSLFGCLRVAFFNELAAVNENLQKHGSCCPKPTNDVFSVETLVECVNNLNNHQQTAMTRHLMGTKSASNLIIPKSVFDSSDTSGCLTDEDEQQSPTPLVAAKLPPVPSNSHRRPSDFVVSCGVQHRHSRTKMDNNHSAIEKDEMAVWNKFFLTMSLALINSVEHARRGRRSSWVPKKIKQQYSQNSIVNKLRGRSTSKH